MKSLVATTLVLSVTALLKAGIPAMLLDARAETCGTQEHKAHLEMMLEQARADGIRYLNAGDNAAKSAAQRALDQVERQAKADLARNAACEPCLEHLVKAYFYQAYFRFSRNYDECVNTAEQALTRFPSNGKIAFFKAYAHYNRNEFDLASKAFKRYLASNAKDPNIEAQVRQLLADSQTKFLGNWYRQGNFYQSRESRIEEFNPQTARIETVFQFTPEWELMQGGQALTQVSAQARVFQDLDTQGYLEQLVSKLVSQTPGTGFTYRVTLVDSPAVNAMTPPGHIIVYSGLLRFVETESQLAGVLAHELAHNYAHHSVRAVIKDYRAKSLIASVARAVNPQSHASQLVTQISAGLGLALFTRAYSRFEEKEADLYGAHILFNAGYNPTSMAEFFVKMYQANPNQPVKFLSTHPPVPDRAEYLTTYLESFPLDRELSLDSATFQKIKAKFPTTPMPTVPTGGRGVLPPGQD